MAEMPPQPRSLSTQPPDHVNLRVTYLIAGNPRPPCALGLVPVSTTIAALKARLQQELLEHPLPHEQRLIYQGRPLLNNNATLQEALRLQSPIGTLPYTIHIIISQPTPLGSDHASSQTSSQHIITPPQNQQQQEQLATTTTGQVPLGSPPLRLSHNQGSNNQHITAPLQQQQQLPAFSTATGLGQAPLGFPRLRHLPTPSQTTVWLASSSHGPQALLFAPGHGYFTSSSPPSVPQSFEASQAASSVPASAIATTAATTTSAQPTPTPTGRAQPATGPPAPQPGSAPRLDGPDQVARRAQPQQLNANANANANAEFFAFVLGRGTWRRYLFLFAAIIVCILPRENPLNEAEAAQRLLREHRERHPTPLLDALYSIEQSVALFLASLIPGVGERHVAVREQVRREEREARERAAQERLERQRQEEAEQEAKNRAKNSKPAAADLGDQAEQAEEASSSADVGTSNASIDIDAATGATGPSGNHDT
ncbi:hypothetical protein DV735_g4064, partial [Chaetothyriales sp. CBS 134920]